MSKQKTFSNLCSVCSNTKSIYKHLIKTRSWEDPRKFSRSNKFHIAMNSSVSIITCLWCVNSTGVCCCHCCFCCSWCCWFIWGEVEKVITFQCLLALSYLFPKEMFFNVKIIILVKNFILRLDDSYSTCMSYVLTMHVFRKHTGHTN